MLDITILAVGSIKDRNYLAAAQEYHKRLQPYAKIERIEIGSVSFSVKNRVKSQEAEGRAIVDYLTKRSLSNRPGNVFLLAERGEMLDSPRFAKWLDKEQPLILVIGGPLGFMPELYQRYKQISLSSLTFPHELAQVMLLEQLYRAVTIINNKDYHY